MAVVLDPLRSDPRCDQLVRKSGLRESRRSSRGEPAPLLTIADRGILARIWKVCSLALRAAAITFENRRQD